MIGRPEMRSPAPALQSGLDRAKSNRNEAISTIAKPETEENLAAFYLARRFGLALPFAQAIAALANVGRVFG